MRTTRSEDHEALTRRAVTAAVEREKEQRRMDDRKAKEPGELLDLLLQDETGQAWKLTINSAGEIGAEIVESDDGSAATGK